MNAMRFFWLSMALMTLTVLAVTAQQGAQQGDQQQQQQQPQQPPPTLPEAIGGCTRTFFSALVQLIPCRAAVAPFSPIPPTESCCSAIVTLGRPCLCLLANGPPLSGIDRSMALQLPQRCSANFPPCDVIN